MMRFRYAYKTSDGVRHEEEMRAASREAVFEELRHRGIKAIKVVALDGSKANGEIRSRTKKRFLVLAAFCGAAIAITFFALVNAFTETERKHIITKPQSNAEQRGLRIAKPRARKQIDLHAITNVVSLTDIFSHPSEIVLANFAEPGQNVVIKIMNSRDLAEDFKDALDNPIMISSSDSSEIADLKRIVAGIKEEAKMLIASGKTFEEAIHYFVVQQQMEVKYRESILKQETSKDDKNRLLSAMGLETIK